MIEHCCAGLATLEDPSRRMQEKKNGSYRVVNRMLCTVYVPLRSSCWRNRERVNGVPKVGGGLVF